jgi:hypothetical protein
MNANDVIESYVHEVAVQLPRKQRNDVAFELRTLLQEGLQDKADAAGREADAAMATELARSFGRPADVAARYRPTLTIIDPADGPGFLRASVIGLAIIWGLGLLASWRPMDSGWDLLLILGPWWVGTVIPSLWWPGVLVVGFGLAARGRRRAAQTADWKPRSADGVRGGRVSLVLGLVGIVCGIYILAEPRRVLDFFWGGRAAPAAYEALTYTDTFLHRQALWIFGLLLVYLPLFLTVLVTGRKSAFLRRLEMAQCLALCAVLLWTVFDGPIFRAESSDQMSKFLLLLIVVVTLLTLGLQLYRRVRPSPSYQTQG